MFQPRCKCNPTLQGGDQKQQPDPGFSPDKDYQICVEYKSVQLNIPILKGGDQKYQLDPGFCQFPFQRNAYGDSI